MCHAFTRLYFFSFFLVDGSLTEYRNFHNISLSLSISFTSLYLSFSNFFPLLLRIYGCFRPCFIKALPEDQQHVPDNDWQHCLGYCARWWRHWMHSYWEESFGAGSWTSFHLLPFLYIPDWCKILWINLFKKPWWCI